MVIDNQSIRRIEEKLYSALLPGRPQIKIARLVHEAFSSEEAQPDEEDINRALALLVSRNDVHSFGSITNWRHSEIVRYKKSASESDIDM